ncbi:PREDICTED: serine/arginine repetitive matrix protein 4 [Tinamus guttatus]|uniref:serine/arginine repetitive matrix protein 4 n=1 Tax=Tinamus guttatus TaxID=94827 RepID=UPI00052F4162|nr:PREDICTED: serine/arginine repetitive matrix protein 4 [Tinamus guttatus]
MGLKATVGAQVPHPSAYGRVPLRDGATAAAGPGEHRGWAACPRERPRAVGSPRVQQGEKQLFEKFWRGTFKAVATPRPESIIVASITARMPLPSAGTLSCLSYSAEDRRPEKASGNASKEASATNGCVKGKERRDHARHRSRSRSCEVQRTPPPARGKKKKKKSGRKKRRRSPSYSPSPVKKKKKKSSKKRKRNRLSSKKRRHSSRGRPRKSRRHRHSHSESSDSHSTNCRSRHRARSREEGRKTRRRRSRRRSKSTAPRSSSAERQASQKASPALPLHSLLPPKEVISQSGSSADLFTKTDSPLGNLASQNGEYHEYDSGNDTSSPPSTQTSSSRSKDSQEKRSLVHDGFGHAFSSGKPKLANSDNSSDSGNSFTSCFSQSKGTALENLSPDAQGQDGRGCLSLYLGCSEKKRTFPPSPAHSSAARPSSRSESYASTGCSSPGSSSSSCSRSLHRKASPRDSRSRSCSSGRRSYSRSPSYSSKSCKKSPGSRNSRPRRSPSYSRYSPGRDREREHKYSSSEKDSHRERGRRRQQRSYSPLRKRRRDSPSHLEARRITSARKRPIPYYRPSPSSSSSASSYSSWYSSTSRSPSRSRSYSSYRTSRSRSWSSSSDNGRGRSRGCSLDHQRYPEICDFSPLIPSQLLVVIVGKGEGYCPFINARKSSG